ncbi:MAG: PepSY domain-containing protein [Terricaulis sp.]
MSLNRRLLVLIALAALLAPAEALARRGRGRGRSGDHDEAREALEHGEALPLAQILSLALRAVPGEILEIELEREHGRLLYEIEILARNGWVRKVILDARTGAVLGVEDEH